LPRLIFSPRAAADLEAIGDHIQVALSPLCFWQFSARLNFELEFLAGMCYFVNSKSVIIANIAHQRVVANADANPPCSLPQERQSAPCCPNPVLGI
jgi:hypothetical protein